MRNECQFVLVRRQNSPQWDGGIRSHCHYGAGYKSWPSPWVAPSQGWSTAVGKKITVDLEVSILVHSPARTWTRVFPVMVIYSVYIPHIGGGWRYPHDSYTSWRTWVTVLSLCSMNVIIDCLVSHLNVEITHGLVNWNYRERVRNIIYREVEINFMLMVKMLCDYGLCLVLQIAPRFCILNP